MIIYIIKSTIGLGILYLFYHLHLRKNKIFSFNRFYLIFSLVFSLLIPFIKIPVKSYYVLSSGINGISFLKISSQHVDTIPGNDSFAYLPQSILLAFLFIISAFLLIRFVFNLVKLIKKIYVSERIKNQNYTLVLVDEDITPYSFIKFVFVNKSDFNTGKINRELILHEEAHCEQYHSIDIIFLEVAHILFWYNPLVWLYRKAVLLNHEYYADDKVLSHSDSSNYQSLLVKLVLQSCSSYLVSNFKYSFIKNRLIMMTHDNPLHNMTLRKLSAFLLFLAVGITLSFSQKSISSERSTINNMQEPRIERADKATIRKGNTIIYSGNTIKQDDIIILSGNVVIRIDNPDKSYNLIKTEDATFDKGKEVITATHGIMEAYKLENSDPIEVISYDTLKYDVASNRAIIKNVNGKILNP